MHKYLLIMICLTFTGIAFSYPYIFLNNNDFITYNTDTGDKKQFIVKDDVLRRVIYQTADIVVLGTGSRENIYSYKQKNFSVEDYIFYDKSSMTKVGEIDTALSCYYDDKNEIFVGLIGGRRMMLDDGESFEVEIHGAYVFNLKNGKIDKICFPNFITEFLYLPGISVKHDENLLVIMTNNNELSYYDLNNPKQLIRKENSNRWSYSDKADFSCGGIGNITFANNNGDVWKPDFKKEEGEYAFALAEGFWLKDKDIYMVKVTQNRYYIFNLKTQKVTHIKSKNYISFYDHEKDIMILTSFMEASFDGFESIKSADLLKKWEISY